MQITMVPEPNYQSTLDDIEGEQSAALILTSAWSFEIQHKLVSYFGAI